MMPKRFSDDIMLYFLIWRGASFLVTRELAEQAAKACLLPGLDFAATGQDMRDFVDHADDRAPGIHLAQHAAVVGGISKQQRVEGDDRHRREAERFGEVGSGYLGSLRY